MLLDTNTLLVATACASLFSAALLIGIYRINPGESAIVMWGVGNILFGIGTILSALHDTIGPNVSSALANLTQTVGFALLATGLMRFLKHDTRPPLVFGFLALQFAVHLYFLFAMPSLWIRMVNTSIFMAVMGLWPLLILRRPNSGDADHSVAIPFLRLGFSLQVIAYLLWFVYAMRVQPAGPQISSHAPLASAALLQILCTIVILNISFVLLVMERIHRLLSHRAAIDDLTAVFNRRAFNQIAEVELARADRSHIWPALLVLDLDHFKSINDRFGHAAGDEVLRRFGALIKSCTRAGDIVARMGGEEFAALLPSTDLARATSVAERIRTTLEEEIFMADGKRFSVTTSIGLTIILPHDTLHCAFARADAALYAAKDSGRNRVMTNTAPLPANEPTVPTGAIRPVASAAPSPASSIVPFDPAAPAPDPSLRAADLRSADQLAAVPLRLPPTSNVSFL
ncbi:MAG TPA: GGDEF domain-containing protein [Pedomonas sp.]|uniref:GGDEF domain-containing protein n=1 Tax=Pedomonas sp. TaxID=2976421 RepID=UPI002F3ED9B2